MTRPNEESKVSMENFSIFIIDALEKAWHMLDRFTPVNEPVMENGGYFVSRVLAFKEQWLDSNAEGEFLDTRGGQRHGSQGQVIGSESPNQQQVLHPVP
jgi:hypothetical protein